MQQAKSILMFLCLLLIGGGLYATHNRAGEIIYKRIGNGSFQYEITVITYTKTGGVSNEADRCSIEVHYGDGEMDTVFRVNGVSSNDCDFNGEMISTNTKMNIYRTTHTYPGVGLYTVWMEDQNRNGGVKNIPNSDEVSFYIESDIVIDVSTGGNTSPLLQNPPIDNGCLKQVYYHNPGAVDPDGDSLVYSLIPCRGGLGQNIQDYVYPNQVSPVNEIFEIDPITGTLTWDLPNELGEYNLAIKIEEWRYKETSGDIVYMGSVVRDMQIDILECVPKEPPVIADIRKTCIEAGRLLTIDIIATDQDDDRLDVTATGIPLNPGEGGSLSPTDNINQPQPVNVIFSWNTRCDHVRFEPYWVVVKAKENIPLSDEELVDFEEIEIQVIAPEVVITKVQPVGASLHINWTTAPCTGADGYDVYRFNDSLGYVASNCNTGVPEALGYTKIGRVEGEENTEFVDDNDGDGLIHGERYCYMVVATYPDRSESYASLEACGELIRDVPILNKVSINTTDQTVGMDSIAWFKPIDLLPETHPGPYSYRLSRSTNGGAFEEVNVSPPADDFLDLDTFFVDTDLNTEDDQFTYTIELLWGEDQRTVGKSRNASSIYLSSTPADNQLTLSWELGVPWKNSEYIVYRFSNNPDSLDTFKEIGRTAETTFVDDGLVNLVKYRYFVESNGRYSSDDLPDDLVNFSQIHTGVPVDKQAPCTPPDRLIQGECSLDEVEIVWNNPNNFCEDVDDVVSYRIYYAPRLGEEMELIQVNNSPDDTIFKQENTESIAGCYVVTAIDSFENESDSGAALCIDNCPYYELPNIFTPGNDGVNDLFVPFPYKYIESIDLTIWNRWGKIVFETKDPDVNWDGRAVGSGDPVPDGTYFYMCTVNEIRLVGIVQREIRSDLTIINQGEDTQIAK